VLRAWGRQDPPAGTGRACDRAPAAGQYRRGVPARRRRARTRHAAACRAEPPGRTEVASGAWAVARQPRGQGTGL